MRAAGFPRYDAAEAKRSKLDALIAEGARDREDVELIAELLSLSNEADALNLQWIDKVYQRRPPKTIVLDMDSSESPTCGEQEGSAYNGHFGCMCYHPVFVFNQLGDVERCAIRPGNVHSA